MNEQHEHIQQIISQVLAVLAQQMDSNAGDVYGHGLNIPIGVSARHVHLSQAHVEHLFGEGYRLSEKSPLSQPGQFAANEQVTIVGPKGALHHVRILGPARELSQVEISATDARAIGIHAPLRVSGDIANSAPITLVGPKGSLYLQEGCIVAAKHIHMSPQDAERFSVQDGQLVYVEVKSERPIIFSDVLIRVNPRFSLEMHVDTDEGNAGFISKGTIGRIIKIQPDVTNDMKNRQQDATKLPAKEQSQSQQMYSKKLLTEKDMLHCQCKQLIVSKKTIVTALAQDKARQKGIKIIRQ